MSAESGSFAAQLEDFLEEVIGGHPLLLAAHHEYDVDEDRATFILGNPHDTHLKFYDYARGYEDQPDTLKSKCLQWTLKETGDLPVVTQPDADPQTLISKFQQALRFIFKESYYNRDIRDRLMTINNDLVLRTNERQLRFTFLQGDTLHGHAYIEPLDASVQIA